MTEKQRKTYQALLKVPGIHRSTYSNYDTDVYLKVIGKRSFASIKIHKSGDFSFVVRIKNKYTYIKNVDSFLESLFNETMIGLAFHLDKLHIQKRGG